jgi:hypothetical protein
MAKPKFAEYIWGMEKAKKEDMNQVAKRVVDYVIAKTEGQLPSDHKKAAPAKSAKKAASPKK